MTNVGQNLLDTAANLWMVDALPDGPTGKIVRRSVEMSGEVGSR